VVVAEALGETDYGFAKPFGPTNPQKTEEYALHSLHASVLNHHPHFIIGQTGVPSVANGHRITK
jgi:hypothetical protein